MRAACRAQLRAPRSERGVSALCLVRSGRGQPTRRLAQPPANSCSPHADVSPQTSSSSAPSRKKDSAFTSPRRSSKAGRSAVCVRLRAGRPRVGRTTRREVRALRVLRLGCLLRPGTSVPIDRFLVRGSYGSWIFVALEFAWPRRRDSNQAAAPRDARATREAPRLRSPSRRSHPAGEVVEGDLPLPSGKAIVTIRRLRRVLLAEAVAQTTGHSVFLYVCDKTTILGRAISVAKGPWRPPAAIL